MSLRDLLGTKHRLHLSIEEVDLTTTPTNEDTTVVMRGPLADVYSNALGKVYDKETPLSTTDDPATPTDVVVDKVDITPIVGEEQNTVETATASAVDGIVLESQAIDAAVAQGLAAAISDVPPSNGGSYQTLYAIDETQVKPDTVVDVTKILAEAEQPENVTVLIDDVVPSGTVAMSDEEATQHKELILGLEHMVVGMGGKVVRTFSAYLASRKKIV